MDATIYCEISSFSEYLTDRLKSPEVWYFQCGKNGLYGGGYKSASEAEKILRQYHPRINLTVEQGWRSRF